MSFNRAEFFRPRTAGRPWPAVLTWVFRPLYLLYEARLARQTEGEPVEKGGWSMLIANAPGADHLDPLVALGLRTGAAAWIGWPSDPKLEELRDQWLDSTDPAEQKRLAAANQEEALSDVVYVPLGRYLQPSAWRKNVTGILKSTLPVFWNVQKA